jgi:ribose-phosphate pyrophosphokinase
VQRIEESPLQEVVVTNSIRASDETRACDKITQVSIAKLLAEAIRRIHNSDSVSSLFA